MKDSRSPPPQTNRTVLLPHAPSPPGSGSGAPTEWGQFAYIWEAALFFPTEWADPRVRLGGPGMGVVSIAGVGDGGFGRGVGQGLRRCQFHTCEKKNKPQTNTLFRPGMTAPFVNPNCRDVHGILVPGVFVLFCLQQGAWEFCPTGTLYLFQEMGGGGEN